MRHYAGKRTPETIVHDELRRIERYDSHFAGRLAADAASIVAILPVWSKRRSAGGRSRKLIRTWPAIVEIGVLAGLRRLSDERVREIWNDKRPEKRGHYG